ncbi:MAG: 4'-phosphopantetheinyl transferase family protein [Crocinitomicaceae bacterium]
MQFIKSKYHIGSTVILLMQYEDFNPLEYLDQLTEIEKERFFEFTNDKRKREFVATRMLRMDLVGFQHIYYNEVGAPFIKGVGYISISHTDNCVGIAYSKKFRLGLDIERVRSKISKIAHKFLSCEEMKSFHVDSDYDLTLAWTAKEVLYKLSRKKGLSFKRDLKIERVCSDKLLGKLIKSDESEEFELKCFNLNDLIITVNTSACERKNL